MNVTDIPIVATLRSILSSLSSSSTASQGSIRIRFSRTSINVIFCWKVLRRELQAVVQTFRDRDLLLCKINKPPLSALDVCKTNSRQLCCGLEVVNIVLIKKKNEIRALRASEKWDEILGMWKLSCDFPYVDKCLGIEGEMFAWWFHLHVSFFCDILMRCVVFQPASSPFALFSSVLFTHLWSTEMNLSI